MNEHPEISEAREIREQARNELNRARQQWPSIEQLAKRLTARRPLEDSFGNDIEITFRPRSSHD